MPIDPGEYYTTVDSDEFYREQQRLLLPLLDPGEGQRAVLLQYFVVGVTALTGLSVFISLFHWVTTGYLILPWWAGLVLGGLAAIRLLLKEEIDPFEEIYELREHEAEIYGQINSDLNRKLIGGPDETYSAQ